MVYKFRIKGMLQLAALFLLVSFISCQEQSVNVENKEYNPIDIDSAEWVITGSIQYHGGNFENKVVEFDFRDKHYKASFVTNENYMTRTAFMGDSTIVDSTSGENALRRINAAAVQLSEKKSKGISNSINSVFYFALLPSKLFDTAVITDYRGIVRTNTGNFHQVAVQFKQEGGGEDFQDKFFYWFNAETFQLSYLAYSYETNGGGIRFRSVEKHQKLNSGFVFQDYVNYKTVSLENNLQDLLPMHLDSGLVELSRIRLENVVVLD